MIFIFQLRMLHIENIFLPLDFGSQLFLGRQVSQILRHEQMVVIMQDRVSRDVLAGFATQKNTDRGVVALFAFEFIVHPNIHINLADILMGDRAHLQVNQNIAFQFDVFSENGAADNNTVCQCCGQGCEHSNFH